MLNACLCQEKSTYSSLSKILHRMFFLVFSAPYATVVSVFWGGGERRKRLPTHSSFRYVRVKSYLGDLLYISKKDLLIAGDWVQAVVFHQVIEGVKLHHP